MMGDRAAKDALYDALSGAARALGNGRRAEIVDVLAQGERPVEELASQIGQSVANTSQHLQQLLRVGLVRTRRSGTRVYYRLASPRVAELCAVLREVATAHQAEIDRLASAYLGDRSQLESMSRAELDARLRRGEVVVLDVRPTAEFEAGHISGARSIPIDDLRRRLRELPADSRVVAYCRGPFCAYADEAVRMLRRRHRSAARLEDGFPEWARAGLPVETGAGTPDADTAEPQTHRRAVAGARR
jgi:rhodanese-related sulfurtransferase/DNA-binding transcriptional ArsR family regulator